MIYLTILTYSKADSKTSVNVGYLGGSYYALTIHNTIVTHSTLQRNMYWLSCNYCLYIQIVMSINRNKCRSVTFLVRNASICKECPKPKA
jgi:hypothetical protein